MIKPTVYLWIILFFSIFAIIKTNYIMKNYYKTKAVVINCSEPTRYKPFSAFMKRCEYEYRIEGKYYILSDKWRKSPGYMNVGSETYVYINREKPDTVYSQPTIESFRQLGILFFAIASFSLIALFVLELVLLP